MTTASGGGLAQDDSARSEKEEARKQLEKLRSDFKESFKGWDKTFGKKIAKQYGEASLKAFDEAHKDFEEAFKKEATREESKWRTFRFFALLASANPWESVLVARIRHTDKQPRRSWWPASYRHFFSVSEIIKPLRKGEGAYFILTSASEFPRGDEKSVLEVGREYFLIINSTGSKPSIQPLIGCCPVPSDTDERKARIAKLKAFMAKNARYEYVDGETRLEADIKRTWWYDTFGRWSPRHDGYMDPKAYGLGRDVVRNAVAKDARLLLVRIIEVKTSEDRDGPVDYRFRIVEDLSGRRTEDGSSVWVHLSKETRDREAGFAKSLPHPYRLPRLTWGNVHMALVMPRKKDHPVMVARMSPCGEDDATVREVRSWFRTRKEGRAEERK